MIESIRLRYLEKPQRKDLEADIEWICESLGFYEQIDREKRASLIFRKLLESINDDGGLSSTILGEEADVTRGAALNHLKRMMVSGIVIKKGSEYSLRCSSLQRTIAEMRRDIDRIFEDLEEIAREIDQSMGFNNR